MADWIVTESAAGPSRKRGWCRFHLWHLFLLVTAVAFACASIKYLIDFRAAKTRFYDAIQSNRLSEVQALLHRYPSLIRTTSPMIRVPGGLTVYVSDESPVGVAVLYDSKDTFDYLLTHHPDLNTRNGAGTSPVIWATCANEIHYLDALVKRGADGSVRDLNGKSALDYARQFGKRAFLDLLAGEYEKERGLTKR